LKLKCYESLSNFDFNVNVRRYMTEELDMYEDGFIARLFGMGKKKTMLRETEVSVGRVQVDNIKTQVESAPGVCNQRLKPKCDEPLSKRCFQFECAALHLGAHQESRTRIQDAQLRRADSHRGSAVQVARIKTRVESASGFSADE
jgi:hypothetical protein